MAVAQSLTITRASLSLADLVITNDPTATDFVITEGGLSFPDFDMRNVFLPDADDVPGSVLHATAQDKGTLALSIDVKGTTLAALQANRRAWEKALSQIGETLTIGLGSETETYPFFPSWPKWGAINSGGLSVRIVTSTVSVPVNPMVVA